LQPTECQTLSLGKHIFGEFRAPRERVWWLQLFPPGGEANSTPPNALAGVEGKRQGGKRREEGRVIGREKQGQNEREKKPNTNFRLGLD